MSKPTDAEIVDVLARRGASMTYVVRNWLGYKYHATETPFVLRRLKALEKAGQVKRVPTTYATQIRWEIVTQPSKEPA